MFKIVKSRDYSINFVLPLKYVCIHFHHTSGYTWYRGMDFHFVSNEGSVVEADLNMPRGLEWDWCLIFRGKQTHTGSRHGCHISLSSTVTPEGSGQGQPLCSGDATKISMYLCRDKNTWTDTHSHHIEWKYISICCLCCDCCTYSVKMQRKYFLSFSYNHQSGFTRWKSTQLVHKPGSFFLF